MRTFMSHPTLSANWSGEYEEKSAEWFELFLDLIVVAACSNVTEKLKEDLTPYGLVHFVVLTSMYTSSWTLYTSFHARFNEKSLLHYLWLYVWFAGLGGMVLAGEPSTAFTIGLILIRIAQLLMYTTVYVLLPQSRCTTKVDMVFVVFSVVTLCTTFVFPEAWTVPLYAGVLVWEGIVRFVAAAQGWLQTKDSIRIPLNIDHFNERVGCMVMVALGEAVVSTIINFKDPSLLTARFFFMMQLGLLVIFTMAMFYFAIQPPREFHAMRRSVYAGITFSWLHLCLYPTLLVIGVSLKLITDAVVADERLESTHMWWLFGSLSAALTNMLFIRLAHYGGRHPAPTDPDCVKTIKYTWWVVAGVAPVVPLVLGAGLQGFFGDTVDPIYALLVAATFNVSFVILETAVMNKLVKLGHGKLGGNNEHTPLVKSVESH
ncbi:hypothetical protein DYB32_001658 [Aphanomyces invadans]|uniref:Low temperature requirement protein LtrA n=1 Tax=Aphanomyces invadans TaxID=157072 RepID=A0A3R6YEA0_9STRA|nr:hypothetical protein DYB32_001658 [Aphanomyces invadans]